jgi:GT2 family glycosyltransferase
MSSVTIITVNFNQKQVTESLLNSIFSKNTFHPLEIIVVDNASKDNPTEGWRKKYPSVKFIRSDKNLGFAGGNNLGVKEATGDYLFFINNDTEITSHLIEGLVTTLDSDPTVGMVSPKIKYFDKPDMLQYAGFTTMNYLTARNHCIGQFEIDNGQYDDTSGETGYCHGAAMMVRREAMNKAGLMAEHYFLYYEEMDWCERIRKAGYKIMLNMQVQIYHKESVSVGVNSPLKEYFMNRNRILFIRRNCGFAIRSIFWLYFLVVVTPRNLFSYVKNRNLSFIAILFRAIGWNLTHSTESEHLGYTLTK